MEGIDTYIVNIASALRDVEDFSPEEFARIAMKNRWPVSERSPGLWEADARYSLYLARTLVPPMIMSIFWSVEDLPQDIWRERLREDFKKCLFMVTSRLGVPRLSAAWGEPSWAYAIWATEHVWISLEETDYQEDRVPCLALACIPRDSATGDPKQGLTARLY